MPSIDTSNEIWRSKYDSTIRIRRTRRVDLTQNCEDRMSNIRRDSHGRRDAPQHAGNPYRTRFGFLLEGWSAIRTLAPGNRLVGNKSRLVAQRLRCIHFTWPYDALIGQLAAPSGEGLVTGSKYSQPLR